MNGHIARFFVGTLLFFALLMLAKTTEAADASLIVTGTVVDPAGAPCDGVKVELVLEEEHIF
jgi:protocatechuate 3,4-dioxygenase beta subunit